MLGTVLEACTGHRLADAAFLHKLTLLDPDILRHHHIYLVTHRDRHVRYLLIVHLLDLSHVYLAVIRLSTEIPQSLIPRMFLILHRLLSCAQVVLIIGL